MGPSSLTCPLCCGEDFPCRDSLRRHITGASHNLRCPACQMTLLSLSGLIRHLEAEQCGGYPLVKEDIVDQMEPTDRISEKPSAVTEADQDLKDLVKVEFASQEHQQPLTYVNSGHNSGNVIEDGDNHILIVGGDTAHILANQNIITTQNEDGTISFTPVDQEETECTEEERLSPGEEESEGEVYSCNTCGVSFTSVIEHIQKYHSEQDVVVEVAEPDSEMLSEELREETIGTKRVITTTGDIVVEAFSQTQHTQKEEGERDVMEEEVVDKSGRAYTRRVIKIDKFWDNEEFIDPTAKCKALVNMKVESESDNKVYSCRSCLKRSTTLEALQNHFCKKDGVYNCSQCPVTYTNPKSLCAHMKVHKIVSKPPNLDPSAGVKKASGDSVLMLFKCEVCETVFPSNKSLRLHKRMHDPVKSRPMEGPVEYISSEVPNGDSDTMDTYYCDLCDKWIHVGYKGIHDNYHHDTVQYHCDICNRKFLSQDYLVMHMNVHNLEKTSVNKSHKVLPYSCLYCQRQFARPHEKVKHERIHTGEKPHTCEICGKAFRVSYCLTLHMRTHTGARPYECQHCGKRFKAHSVYNHHLLTHSDVRAFKCPYCPKAFKTSVQLAGHKNSHTKPFSCTHCNRPFASLYAVRVHTETHRRQNNLKFSCKLCGASYARAFALKDHMKSVHETVADNSKFMPSEAGFETDPALAILPKTEENLEVEELPSSEVKPEIVINDIM